MKSLSTFALALCLFCLACSSSNGIDDEQKNVIKNVEVKYSLSFYEVGTKKPKNVDITLGYVNRPLEEKDAIIYLTQENISSFEVKTTLNNKTPIMLSAINITSPMHPIDKEPDPTDEFGYNKYNSVDIVGIIYIDGSVVAKDSIKNQLFMNYSFE